MPADVGINVHPKRSQIAVADGEGDPHMVHPLRCKAIASARQQRPSFVVSACAAVDHGRRGRSRDSELPCSRNDTACCFLPARESLN